MRAFAAAAVLAQLVAAAVDLASIPRESSSNIVPGVYIVELSTGSHLKRGFESPHAELYHDLSRRGALWEVTQEFSGDILTGATLKLGSETDLLKLAQSDGVQSIFPVYSHPMPEPINPYTPTGPEDPRCHPKDTLSTHLMTGVDKLHAEGILGQGIKIGIIDTGIDYTHPALGGKFGPGNKVIGGYDFVGDAYRGSSGPAPVPDNDPLDQCNGHGTHVAGILGANPDNPYNISGVAYKSSLNAYRIFGCSGSASDDLIVAALMRAWQDGNDVITLSLGIPDGWTMGMTGVVASRIAGKGKIVVATAGNDGAYGSWYPNSPGAGLNVISVGSVNNVIINVQNATLSNGRTIPYYSFLPLPFPSNLPMYATSDITATADACKPLPNTTPDLSNFLVVIRRGGCALVDKFANVVAKGGRYYLLYDNIVEPLGAFDFGNYTSAGISKEDGEYLVQQAIPANLTISFFNTPFDYPLATGGLMSSFSSYGPTYDMYLKPAVAAPGGEILSTFPVKLGSYKLDSGTSMAAPFVAGSAALLLQARGKTATVAKSAKSVFESTALPIRFAAGNSSLFETAAHQGAGLIQVYDAIKNQGSMSPAELLLNDTENFKKSHDVTIRNNGRKSVTYTLTHVAAGTANTISGITARTTVSLISNAATVSFSPSKLTIWPGTSATFRAQFTAPTGLNATSFPVYSGFIKATGSDGSSLHSTYLGLAAPIKSMRIVDNTTAYFGTKLPLIQGNNSKPINETTVFTMNGTDFPLMLYRLVAGSPKVQIDLIKSTTKVTTNLRKKRFTPLPQLGQSVPADHHAVHLLPVERPIEKRSIWDWVLPYGGFTHGGSFVNVPIVGTIYQRDYQGRNSPASTTGANGYESLKVDKFANGTAIPDGNYKVLLRALKITGNWRSQEHYEVWTSPELQIKRA